MFYTQLTLISQAIMEAIHNYIYINCILAGIMAFILLLFFVKKDNKKIESILKHIVSWDVLFIYLCFVIEITLLSRPADSRTETCLTIFGTFSPNPYLLSFVIENVLLTIPFGMLLPCIIKKLRKWYRVFLCGLCLTLFIEITQYVTGRGYFQADDIWLNVVGTMIGYGLFCILYHFTTHQKHWYAWIPAILMMGLIFGFSGENGEQSASLSLKVTRKVVHVMEKVLPQKTLAKWSFDEMVETLHIYVRKAAHMTEYALLCLSIWIACIVNDRKRMRYIVIAIIFCFFYACLDEFHQTFISGRCGTWIDVGIDTLGAGIAGIICRYSMRRNKHHLKSHF